MAIARGTEAYDYNKMNMARSNAAPKTRPTPQSKPAPRPKVIKKTQAQLRAESKRSTAKAIKVMAIAGVFFTIIAFQIFSQVKVDELNRQLSSLNSQISVLDSENTRLNMQLDARISLDKVDDYAQDVLGMVKVENYQVSYVDLSGSDSVKVSGGKIHKGFWQTLKAYLT